MLSAIGLIFDIIGVIIIFFNSQEILNSVASFMVFEDEKSKKTHHLMLLGLSFILLGFLLQIADNNFIKSFFNLKY